MAPYDQYADNTGNQYEVIVQTPAGLMYENRATYGAALRFAKELVKQGIPEKNISIWGCATFQFYPVK